MTDDLLIARAVHVLSIVVWFGGVAFVTFVVLPLARRQPTAEQKLALFEAMEGRFGTIARWAVALAGLSGLWMLRNNDLWYRFAMPAFWWMWAMAGLWLVFAFVLFVAEPLWLHAAFRRRVRTAPEATFAWAFRLHLLLLLAGAVTIAGAVFGAH
ncbi:DUF4149 domain-containing protein [Ferrovibrio xuzhouensis]|uniref:DUF4149 domain-containing protein n=1 Tax=Ferrovibrio xuzhouensis TaxID=1576914 RepID=A0ABV7VD71_9PROT